MKISKIVFFILELFIQYFETNMNHEKMNLQKRKSRTRGWKRIMNKGTLYSLLSFAVPKGTLRSSLLKGLSL